MYVSVCVSVIEYYVHIDKRSYNNNNNNILTDMTVATAIYFESIKIKFVLFNLEISSVGRKCRMDVCMDVYYFRSTIYIFYCNNIN